MLPHDSRLPIDDALAIWQAGVSGVLADTLVENQIALHGTGADAALLIGDAYLPVSELDRLVVVGAGKAGAAMVRGLQRALCRAAKNQPQLGNLVVTGLISVPAGTELLSDSPDDLLALFPHYQLELAAGRPAELNEPTAAGVQLSKRMLALVGECGPRDACLVLLSGGGSALLPLPKAGISLEDKLRVIQHLSAAGANIESLNVVRKHLSDIKGGKLAAACRANWLVTLVISDVLGDPLDLIASGPTVPDQSTPRDALDVLTEFDPEKTLPESVYRLISEENDATSPSIAQHSLPPNMSTHETSPTQESPTQESWVHVIGNNPLAVDIAGMEAERRGYSHIMNSATRSEGSAEAVGRQIAELALTFLHDKSVDSPDCYISGGEPVVTLAPAEIRGRGGRNQQLVLAALARFQQEPLEVQNMLRANFVLFSAGTDGEDGPTDAAGAWLDDQVWSRAEQLNLDVADYLRRNDAYHFFQQTGGLIKSGPTGTNVCDLRVLICRKARFPH
ncbi:glycerate kinase type-2 family protein [Planctomycetaceae bacterium SH139]